MQRAWTAWIVAAALAVAGCSDGGDEPPTSTTSTTITTSTTDDSPTSTTTEASPSTGATSTTGASSTTAATSTTAAALAPGDPCSLGSVADCIDPDGDGQGTYLLGGDDCIAAYPDSPGLCTDLDGDGRAGYPDAG